MRILYMIITAVVVACITPPANATFRCVENVTWGDDVDSSGKSSWSVKGPTGLFNVRGIGICGQPTSPVSTSEIYQASARNNYGNATRCYCLETYPVLSDWFYVYDYDSNDECITECPSECATEFNYSTEIEATPADPGITTVGASECPTGWLSIKNNSLTFTDGTCPAGTVDAGPIISCSAVADDPDSMECGLFIPAGKTTGRDETGEYESDGPLCPYTE